MLCSKGPSFIPKPNYFGWRQLQIDFDKFENTLRKISFFSTIEAGSNANKNTTLSLAIDNPWLKQSLWIPPKSNSNEIETFISLVEKDLFQDTSRKRIPSNLSQDEKKALKDWRKNVLFNKDSDKVMRLQDKGNRFIIVDKQTDCEKANEQIERSSFLKIDYDPTTLHINKVKDWTNKWISRNEISKEWAKYIVNVNAVPGKNSTLYKTHKPNNPVRLLTTGCNTAIENLLRFIEVVCAPLTNNIETRIRDTSHLLDIIDELNLEKIPDNIILVSFDIVNMYPSIDNDRDIAAIRNALETMAYKSPSTDCIIEFLEICLKCNNSRFVSKNLFQLNGTATGAPNSCSYADLAVFDIDNSVLQAKINTFQEIRHFGRYRDDCLAL